MKNPGSPAQLAYLNLTAPEPADRTCLTVAGRPLWATSAGSGVLQVRFDELCQRPTSVGDLLEQVLDAEITDRDRIVSRLSLLQPV